MTDVLTVKKPRILWIEIARVIAVFSVVLQHVPRECPANAPVLTASLALFFMLSGYFFAPKLSDSSFKIQKKLIPLLRCYVVWNVICGVLFWGAVYLWGGDSPIAPDGSFWSTALKWLGIGNSPILMPMWFVRDLMVYSLAAFLLCRLGKAGVTVLWVLGLTCLFLKNVTYSHDWTSLYMFGNFCLGMMLWRIPDLLKKWHDLPISIHYAITLAYMALVAWVTLDGDFVYQPITPLGVAAILSVSVLLEKLPIGRFLASCGSATFFVFCSHIFFMCMLMSIEDHTFPWPDYVWWGMAVVIYSSAVMTYRLLKKKAPRVLGYLDSKA